MKNLLTKLLTDIAGIGFFAKNKLSILSKKRKNAKKTSIFG
jgi:hypothetical protein